MTKLASQEVTELLHIELSEDERRSKLYNHFQAMLVESGNKLTDEVLQVADRLYDVQGMPYRLAKALGIRPYDLRKELAREITVECLNCGYEFQALELRRYGGYTPTDRDLCNECERKKREQEHASSRAEEQRRQITEREQWHRKRAEYLLKAQVDAELLEHSNALRLIEFKEHLKSYLDYWLSEPTVWRYTSNYHTRTSLGPGCMLCGQLPGSLHVLVTRHTPLADGTFWHIVNDALFYTWTGVNRYYQITWPPMGTHYQVLWRLSPEDYFNLMPIFPFQHVPLLLTYG